MLTPAAAINPNIDDEVRIFTGPEYGYREILENGVSRKKIKKAEVAYYVLNFKKRL